jgi:hypothetical protein
MAEPYELLQEAAAIQQRKDEEYDAAWKKFGPQLATMFPDGVTLVTARDFGRFALFVQALGKLGRYAGSFSEGGHEDSARDLTVYAAMLQSMDSSE